MTDLHPQRANAVIEAAQALYGAMNSAFEDWEKRDIPPAGYQGLFAYDISPQTARKVQADSTLDLKSIGIDGLRSPTRWGLSIDMQSSIGQLGISRVIVPLARHGQQLVFRHKEGTKDQFGAYIKKQDESFVSLCDVRRGYVHTLLAKAGVHMPDSFDLNPAQRTLALADIANGASAFDIVQRQSLPVHPTQEITFEKINSLTDPKQTSRTVVHKRKPTLRTHSQPRRSSYDTMLRAFYLQTNSDGVPLYSQTVTFEGSDAQIAMPIVELETYEQNPVTGKLRPQRAKTNEQVSAQMLSYIEAGLFEAIYGGKRLAKLPSESE